MKDDNWISVKDEMPSKEGTYLCHFDDGVIETFNYSFDDDVWGVVDYWNVITSSYVTHWMPMPRPPKGDS
jgi:hypothetical protein